MKKSLYVILVNYNGKKYNKQCIDSILKSESSKEINIVVVDNASTDGSTEELDEIAKNVSRVHIIKLDNNFGFAKGNNEGIAWALEQGADYILLLNNDTVIESDAIEEMLKLQEEKKCVVVPKIMYADNPDVIWCAGGKFSKIIKKSSHIGLNQKDKEQFRKHRICSFANGCCMMLSKELVQKNGLLDEKFFLYYEDNEYSLRMMKKNIPIWYCAKSIVYHKVNGATRGNQRPANAYYITRNWLICSKMYLGATWKLFCVYFFFNRIVWGVLWLLQGKSEMVKAMIEGIKDYRKGITGEYMPDLEQ